MNNPIIDEDGNKFWYNEKIKFHRIDGPAVEWSNGDKFWWIEGKNYTEEEFNKKVYEMNNTKDKNPKIDKYGTKRWFNEKGEKHRLDGPAVEYSNGDKFWLINGKYHRLDGPAIEWANGNKYWYIEGKQYTEEEYNKKVSTKLDDFKNFSGKKENNDIVVQTLTFNGRLYKLVD